MSDSGPEPSDLDAEVESSIGDVTDHDVTDVSDSEFMKTKHGKHTWRGKGGRISNKRERGHQQRHYRVLNNESVADAEEPDIESDDSEGETSHFILLSFLRNLYVLYTLYVCILYRTVCILYCARRTVHAL